MPTGGGKTVIGARAVRVFKDELVDENQPLVLWLVPSEAIKSQAVNLMKNLSSELRRVQQAELADPGAVPATGHRGADRDSHHGSQGVRVGGGYHFICDPNAYPARWICKRSGDFTKHYYENVGELETETTKGNTPEEFLCAQYLDEQPEVEWWVRNLDRQPVHSFWLQTSSDRFFPRSNTGYHVAVPNCSKFSNQKIFGKRFDLVNNSESDC